MLKSSQFWQEEGPAPNFWRPTCRDNVLEQDLLDVVSFRMLPNEHVDRDVVGGIVTFFPEKSCTPTVIP